ncbi:MAG: hypothetical protein P4L53_06780 [Candidatus Obscuribacterales bacterium]|nr:hypothetical protein [Candidatus Obscuribacterales bacterium]
MAITNVGGYDFFEIVVKENGIGGMLLCAANSGLSTGQEFIAQFVQIDHNGKYIVQGALPIAPLVPGGGEIIPFPFDPSMFDVRE